MDSPPLLDVPHSRSLILSDLARNAGRTCRSATTFTCGGETFVVNFPGDLHQFIHIKAASGVRSSYHARPQQASETSL